MNRYLLSLLVISLMTTGCSTIRQNKAYCIAAGALIGGAGAAIAEDDNEEDAALVGAVVGGAIAWFVCRDDADGDGVTDANDRCPTTPRGAAVNSEGCTPDADGDGIADFMDQCPATPRGVAVNADGCARDTDGDGVTDDLDRCPGTPAGTPVDNRGCILDSDGDGVVDSADQCPGTPAGRQVDARGCEQDADLDGVVDGADQCPDTPRGRSVNSVGCHVILSLEGLNFENNSYELTSRARVRLEEAVNVLNADRDVRVMIEGHTDSRGDDAYNQRLSEQRALSVRDFLIEQGIDAGRLESRGLGESKPVASNTTEEGRARNRRVDFVVADD